jgi:hypothetical protein
MTLIHQFWRTALQDSYNIATQQLQGITEELALINTMLGIDQTSESTESSESSPITDIFSIAAEVAGIFDEFKAFIAALGLSSEVDEEGNDILSVASDLNVLGNTTLSDLTVTGDLAVGLLEINSLDNSIDVLGPPCGVNSILCESQTLHLQKGLAGNVNIFDGQVVIEPSGNLLVQGTIEAETVVAEEFKVKSTSANIGSDIMLTGNTEVTILTSSVTETSKIFITSTSSTNDQVLYVSAKTANESFTVTLDQPAIADISFDWWVLSIEDQVVESTPSGEEGS